MEDNTVAAEAVGQQVRGAAVVQEGVQQGAQLLEGDTLALQNLVDKGHPDKTQVADFSAGVGVVPVVSRVVSEGVVSQRQQGLALLRRHDCTCSSLRTRKLRARTFDN